MSYTVQAAEPDAGQFTRGVVTTAAQTFAGAKSFIATMSTGDVRPIAAYDSAVDIGAPPTLRYRGIYQNGTHFNYVAAGSDALALLNAGARLHLGPGTTDYLVSNGSTRISAAGDFLVAGTTYVDTIKGAGSANFSFSSSLAGITPSNAMMNIYPQGAVDPTDLLLNILDGTPTSKFTFNAQGDFSMVGALGLLSFADDSATTGNRTVNKVRGINAFAAAATAITITNSFVTATSTVLAVLQTNDGTAVLKNVVPASGSFTINLNAAATGITKVAWVVLN